jgi:FkbM family methyltransferase
LHIDENMSIHLIRSALPHFIVNRLDRFAQCRSYGMSLPSSFKIALGSASWSRFRDARLDMFSRALRQGEGIVVDAGANVGDWTAAVLDAYGALDTLVIEPNPNVYVSLAARFAASPNVRCSCVGLADRESDLELVVSGGSQFASFLPAVAELTTLYGDQAREVRRVKVPVVRLDTLVHPDQRVQLLKLDVQGYEMNVLAGAVNTLARTEMILVEANWIAHYEGACEFSELDKFLVSRGFVLANLSPPFISRGKALWSDALYVRR